MGKFNKNLAQDQAAESMRGGNQIDWVQFFGGADDQQNVNFEEKTKDLMNKVTSRGYNAAIYRFKFSSSLTFFILSKFLQVCDTSRR